MNTTNHPKGPRKMARNGFSADKPSPSKTHTCSVCEKGFIAYRHKNSSRLFCSRKCYYLDVSGKGNGNWKGGKNQLKHVDERIRSVMNCAIRNRTKHSNVLLGMVGYDIEKLKRTLEKQFKPGMSWDNRKQWHIDHIIPRSAFNYTTDKDLDFRRCWGLKNLQPLWPSENLRKHSKLRRPFQPMLRLQLKEG